MLPILQIGPLALPVAPLLILAGVWLGLTAAERASGRHAIHPNDIYNLVFYALIAGLVGARLVSFVRHPDIFLSEPLNFISRDLGLLDPWGGAAAAGVTALAYGQRRGMPLWRTLDALTPGLAVFAVFLGLAHLASGSAFGAPTQVPWGIQLWGARRHPSQVYEILAAGLVLLIVSRWADRFAGGTPGVRFLLFTALSAGARLFLEAFRGDSLLVGGGLRSAQLWAWLVLAASLWGIYRLQRLSPASQSLEAEAMPPGRI